MWTEIAGMAIYYSDETFSRRPVDVPVPLNPASTATGWKCSGCHASNGPHEAQCSWCRTYRTEDT